MLSSFQYDFHSPTGSFSLCDRPARLGLLGRLGAGRENIRAQPRAVQCKGRARPPVCLLPAVLMAQSWGLPAAPLAVPLSWVGHAEAAALPAIEPQGWVSGLMH